jgi:O-antigen/teichoic acid export membrane protein
MSKLYLKNVGAVLMGTVVSQIIPVLGSLILARQFFPADFGAYSVWLGVTVFVSVCLTGRFETSLPMEDDGKFRALAVLYVLVTTLILSLFPLLILVLFFLIGVKSIGLMSLKFLISSLLVSLLMSFVQTWQTWAAAEGFYKKLSLIRIAQAGLVVTFQVGIGLVQPDVMGLILGHFIGFVFSFLICILLMPVSMSFDMTSLKFGLLAFWRRNKKFPLFSLPADAINTAAGQLPLLLIASKFGADIAGYYALTIRVLGAPIALLGSSALDVFKRHAASAYRTRGECSYEYMHTFKILSIATILTSVLFFFFAEQLFAVAYGEGWSMSGKIAIWLIPLFAFRFVASPLSYMVYIAGKQHFDLLWQICLIGVTFLSLNYIRDFDGAIKLYSFGYASLYLIYIWMSYNFSLGCLNDRDN